MRKVLSFAFFPILLVLRSSGGLLSSKPSASHSQYFINRDANFSFSINLNGSPQALLKPPNLTIIKSHFEYLFSYPRSHQYNIQLKEFSRKGIVNLLTKYGLEVNLQRFKVQREKTLYGVNIIGIIPGINRGTSNDKMIVVGAHYDTLFNSPGVSDNGSGCVALLEMARIISRFRSRLSSTILIVFFDLEELGALGSEAFVDEYLIPQEILHFGSKYVGAFVIDMLLNYEPEAYTQTVDDQQMLFKLVPELEPWFVRNKFRGNFIAATSRNELDEHLVCALIHSYGDSNQYKLLSVNVTLPEEKTMKHPTNPYFVFLQSDHQSFWTKRQQSIFNQTLPAVLIESWGLWRRSFRRCYHKVCDNKQFLTESNLRFLKHNIKSILHAVFSLAL